jgi:uncharacterized protein YggU (UPF0235/DUF167 family)
MTLQLRVIPKAQRTEWAETMADGTRKVRVAAAPERGKANAELIRFLAHEYGVPQRAVTLLRGETAHNKTFRIAGVD